ncbi:MAG: hypothetical protein IPH31_25250 [Lewinellaceae bacterium]|nr:hypothetical protein [Lewinellaceae bacterium]
MKNLLYVAQSLAKSFIVVILVAFSASMYAQQASLTVQGVLTKADGTAVEDDVYTLTFRLWNHPDATGAGNKKHEETINNVETVGGVYTVIMGVNGTPLAAGFDEVYYLGVSMNTSTVELLPRPRLTHAPYALGIKGQNNTFPNTGPVIGDAFRAKGGPATGGLGPTANGFSFQSPSGNDSGGMFSEGDNNIEFWAGASKRVKLTNTQNDIYGQTVNFGPFISNDLTVNGNSQVNGSQTVTQNQTVNGASTISGGQTVNSGLTVNGDQHINSGNLFVNGKVISLNGYSFSNDGAYDSGLYSGGDGIVRIYSNVDRVAEFGHYQAYDNGTDQKTSSIRFWGIQKGPNSPQVEWDQNTGELQVDNSSRKHKRNIQDLTDDYRLILKVQPKLYNRIGYPDSLVELGYIAKEFDSIGLTRLVFYDRGTGEVIGVNYDKVSIYLTEVVKDHEAELKKTRVEIAALKAEVAALQSANAGLRSDNSLLQKQQASFSPQLEALTKRMNALESNGAQHERK